MCNSVIELSLGNLVRKLLAVSIFNHYVSSSSVDHFTVVRLVAWPLNENEAGGVVLIETSLLFLCKFVLICTRTTALT